MSIQEARLRHANGPASTLWPTRALGFAVRACHRGHGRRSTSCSSSQVMRLVVLNPVTARAAPRRTSSCSRSRSRRSCSPSRPGRPRDQPPSGPEPASASRPRHDASGRTHANHPRAAAHRRAAADQDEPPRHRRTSPPRVAIRWSPSTRSPPSATGVGVAVGKRTSPRVGPRRHRRWHRRPVLARSRARRCAPRRRCRSRRSRSGRLPHGDYGYFDAGKDYPAEARQLGIEGAIRVRLVVDAQGKVASRRCCSTSSGTASTSSPCGAATQIVFDPARDTRRPPRDLGRGVDVQHDLTEVDLRLPLPTPGKRPARFRPRPATGVQ